MTSSVACANFHPNLWRQTICANCMRPKSRHESSASEAEEHIRSRSSTCTGVPEEKLPAAGSGAAAAAAAIAVINAASTFPDHRARKEHKVAGEEKQVGLANNNH